MKRFYFVVAVAFGFCAPALAQMAANSDTAKFTLSPTAPPEPALTYQLLFDNATDRRTGNAATLYFDSILLLGPDAKQKSHDALDAYNKGDTTTFDKLASELDNGPLFRELDLAARRDTCDWQLGDHEMGAETLLPHLEPLVHAVTDSIRVKTLRQIEQGQLEDALKTLRLGYELGEKVGQEPMLISGLVSISITSRMNVTLNTLMNQPQAPNLYWALLAIPPRREIMQNCVNGERLLVLVNLPGAADVMAGGEASPQQWRAATDYINRLGNLDSSHPSNIDLVGGTSTELMQQAREQYAEYRHLSPDEVAKVDPIIILGHFYGYQWLVTSDDLFKLFALPYPQLLPRTAELEKTVAELQSEEPANPFMHAFPTFHKEILSFARADRQLAAFTAVEALRSYAAANGGKFPAHLEDITDTPVPLNPVTGKAFEYQVDGDTAVLADSTSEETLRYEITLRK